MIFEFLEPIAAKFFGYKVPQREEYDCPYCGKHVRIKIPGRRIYCARCNEISWTEGTHKLAQCPNCHRELEKYNRGIITVCNPCREILKQEELEKANASKSE